MGDGGINRMHHSIGKWNKLPCFVLFGDVRYYIGSAACRTNMLRPAEAELTIINRNLNFMDCTTVLLCMLYIFIKDSLYPLSSIMQQQ